MMNYLGAFLFGTIFLSFGVVLLRPVRRGSDPHCCSCNYNLTGLVHNRCPECGIEISEKTVKTGCHVRSPLFKLLGILFLLPPFYIAYQGGDALIHHNWYQYKPEAWMIEDLSSNNPVLADEALNHLRVRFSQEKLSAEGESDLMDHCIAVLHDPAFSRKNPLHFGCTEFLNRAFMDERIPDEKQQELYKKTILDVQPVHDPANSSDYWVRFKNVVQSRPVPICLLIRATVNRVFINDKEISTDPGSPEEPRYFKDAVSIQIHYPASGTHTLTVDYTVNIFTLTGDRSNPILNRYEKNFISSVDFTVSDRSAIQSVK